MTSVYTTPTAFGTTVAVFICPCGRKTTSVGIATRELPRGWVEASAERDEHLCPECARSYSEALARSK